MFNSAWDFLKDYRPIRSNAQWIKEISAVTLEQVQALANTLEPVRSFCKVQFPEGSTPPVGLPVYDLYAANNALREGRTPVPLDPLGLTL